MGRSNRLLSVLCFREAGGPEHRYGHLHQVPKPGCDLMAENSAIEWTETTWNPVTGCTKVSPGCKHCYAERLAARLKRMGNPRYINGFDLTLQPDQIELPLRWKRPRRVFVNSMSDLFHTDIPDTFIESVFRTMA